MKKPFKQETPTYSSPQAETPYLRAQQEWNDRLGNVSARAANWRLFAVLALVLAVILAVLLLISITTAKYKVFVAEVTKAGRVVNVAPLRVQYEPNVAQIKYFIGHFIKLIREIPLDPVVAKKNWLTAYNFLTTRSSKQLNAYFQKANQLQLLGKKTVTVKLVDINQISKQTFQVDWVETMVNASGMQEGQKKLSGVFTIMLRQPASEKVILQNPLGLYIVDFNVSERDSE